jgi:hypothetical protein
MINKKIGVLAAAVMVASTAQASFESDSQVFIAVDTVSSDTYVLDLGAAGSVFNEATTGLTFANYTWTVVGGKTGSTQVASPPGNFQGYSDQGIYSLGATDGNTSSTIAVNNSVDSKVTAHNTWLSQISTAAAGADFVVIPNGVQGDYTAGLQAEYNPNRMQTGTSTIGDLAYSLGFIGQGSGSIPSSYEGIDGSAVTASTQFDFDGSTVSAVPVPAAAWLFGSALAGLTVIRRRK